MITRRTWMRKTYEKGFRRDTGDKKYVYRTWSGLFLFGFIPLWLDNHTTEYRDS